MDAPHARVKSTYPNAYLCPACLSFVTMFRALAQRAARPVMTAQKRGMAKATRLPPAREAAESSLKLNWFSDSSAYPIFVVMGFGGIAVLSIWTHGLTNPEVHIMKGDRGTLDYVENDHDHNPSWGSHRGDSHLRRR